MGAAATLAELEARLEGAALGAPRLELELGRRWIRHGVPEHALRWLSSARARADAAGDRRAVAEADLDIGAMCAMRGEHDFCLAT